LWQNMHYYKGMHRSLPAANVTRSVPAVTGACLMIARALYQQAGGFQDTYLQGDHEDSDLCLRLVQLGYENWYLADVELYHLEAQSYPGPLRGLTALYNRWLHTRMWNEQIEALMNRYSSPTTHMIHNSSTDQQQVFPTDALALVKEREEPTGRSGVDRDRGAAEQQEKG
jgi:GT2 family glycosyltransferase